MKCDDVKEQLAEHLLGSLDGPEDLEVRRHLRGCSSCRSELASLAEGMSMFASAAHETEPPEDLRGRVLGVLEGEWSDASSREAASGRSARRPVPRFAAAAVVVALVGSLGWATVATGRADQWHAEAVKYDQLLGILGGKNVRVARLSGTGNQWLEGSAVLYDASPGNQSWALVLIRAPGLTGQATAVLTSSADGSTIKMRPLHFEPSGEASTWLVTSANLQDFNRVTIAAPDGSTLASGGISAS